MDEEEDYSLGGLLNPDMARRNKELAMQSADIPSIKDRHRDIDPSSRVKEIIRKKQQPVETFLETLPSDADYKPIAQPDRKEGQDFNEWVDGMAARATNRVKKHIEADSRVLQAAIDPRADKVKAQFGGKTDEATADHDLLHGLGEAVRHNNGYASREAAEAALSYAQTSAAEIGKKANADGTRWQYKIGLEGLTTEERPR